jgi:hypothetical protein
MYPGGNGGACMAERQKFRSNPRVLVGMRETTASGTKNPKTVFPRFQQVITSITRDYREGFPEPCRGYSDQAVRF